MYLKGQRLTVKKIQYNTIQYNIFRYQHDKYLLNSLKNKKL